ncbi:MAG: histidine phosphatase family protein [Granulosicoccus sp.]|nr:histidine phosphatase family protein [Granulosicoccus sp.]
MSLLYLIRHGQASAGTHDYDRLSALGLRQAQLLGQWWNAQGFAPDSVWHGSLIRQRETARLALESMDHTLLPDVHEGLNEYNHRVIDRHFGEGSQSDDPESLTFDDYVRIMQRWREHEAHPDTPEIEPWSEFAVRGWQTVLALHEQQGQGHNHVFFTSGGVIATLLSHVLGLDFSHTVDAIWRIRNTSITTLHFDGRHARLVDFNTIPHLQVQNDAALITLI